MTFSLGMIGAGQFAGSFAKLFRAHPLIGRVLVTDLIRDRAAALAESAGLDGVVDDADALLASDVDAIAIFTQRWTHAELAIQALRAGKQVYSTVPMATTRDEIAAILAAVIETGGIYMMGETSHYNPATVFARGKLAAGAFGRLVYAEGDYLHDMDHGFYDAYRYSGGPGWKRTASYPPMLYATHSVGGVLGAWPTHAVSVSCIGIRDDRDDGVFDRGVSVFDNDISNASALFELADGGAMRINEMRRIGYPSHLRESRFRFLGTNGGFEQLARASTWYESRSAHDVTELLQTSRTLRDDDVSLTNVAPDLRSAFVSGHAQVHDTSVLPREFDGMPNGHEGSHQFLAHEFASAVAEHRLPAVNAWVAARYTLPGIVAHESARRDGARLPIEDFGDPPSN